MKTIDAGILAAMAARRGRATHLLAIHGGAVDLFWTDAPFPVTYDGEGYVQQWYSVGDVVIDDTGNQAVDLAFPDVGRIVRGLLYNEDWSYRLTTLREVWFDAPVSDGAVPAVIEAHIIADGRADAGSANFEDPTEPVPISIAPETDAEGAPAPAQEYGGSCRYVNAIVGVGKSSIQCGYAGADAPCDGTYARCLALGNQTRHGGFRFAPPAGSTITVGAGSATVGTR